MSIEEQVSEHSRNLQTQSYSMSVSEIVSMYKDGELELHPEFQRFFRWTREQKSRLIESLVLGIPVPPIFVSERSDGKWDVIDGLQRLSTILELMGELRDTHNELKEPLILTSTHYISEFEGKQWEADDKDKSLPDMLKIKFKRARIDVNIVSSSSDEEVKYEVFQRLNTGGASATDQEVRNCMLVMASNEFFGWLKSLSEHESFIETLSLTDRAIDEAFDMELISRYLIFTRHSYDELRKIDELGSYLNNSLVAQAKDESFPIDEVERVFKTVFGFLSEALGSNSFKKFNQVKGVYSGPMLVSLYEVIAVGLALNLLNGDELPDKYEFCEKHKTLWPALSQQGFIGSGVRASTRVPETVQFGIEWFRS